MEVDSFLSPVRDGCVAWIEGRGGVRPQELTQGLQDTIETKVITLHNLVVWS